MSKHHLIMRSLAASAVIAAAGFPASAQALVDPGAPPGTVPSGPSVPQPVATSHTSFQWGDAGIGAAAMAGLLSTGTARTVRRARLLLKRRRETGVAEAPAAMKRAGARAASARGRGLAMVEEHCAGSRDTP
jgi:hypothetical protein